jgi:stearoyl-CoA desaturase (delta-9 desaturase)
MRRSGKACKPAKLVAAQHKAYEVLTHIHLPRLPTRDEIRGRASSMFVKTRSLDDIVERAHRMVLEAVGTRLVGAAGL